MRFLISAVFILSAAGLFSQVDDLMKAGDKAFSKGDYTACVESYSMAIESEPVNVNAHIQRGLAYSILKEYEKAVDDFNTALSLDNGLVHVRNSRGSAYLKLKQYDKAMEDFNAVLSADPENQEAYNNRGWCKKHKGDDKGACDDWKQSKKLGNSEAKIILKNNGC